MGTGKWWRRWIEQRRERRRVPAIDVRITPAIGLRPGYTYLLLYDKNRVSRAALEAVMQKFPKTVDVVAMSVWCGIGEIPETGLHALQISAVDKERLQQWLSHEDRHVNK